MESIKHIRLQMGLSQWELAHKAGISESSVRRAERAHAPGEVTMQESTVIKLCRVLTISPEEFDHIYKLLLPYPELKGLNDEQRTE